MSNRTSLSFTCFLLLSWVLSSAGSLYAQPDHPYLSPELTGAQLIDSLLAVSERRQDDSTELAIDYAFRAAEEATRIRDEVRRAQAQFQYGTVTYRSGETSEAYQAFMEAGRLFRFQGNELYEGKCHRHIGMLYGIFGEFEQAEESYEKALAIFRRLDVPLEVAKVISNQGVLLSKKGKYPESLTHLLEAYEIKKAEGTPADAAQDLINIAVIYNMSGDWEQSYKSLKEAESVFQGTAYQIQLGQVYSTMGSLHYYQDQMDSAEYYYKSAIDLATKAGSGRTVFVAMDNLSSVFLTRSMPDSALFYLEKVLERGENLNETHQQVGALIKMGYVYDEQGDFEKAMAYTNDALEVAKSYHTLKHIRDAYEALTRINENNGKYKDALSFQKQYTLYRDSVLSQSRMRKIEQMRTQMETKELEQEIVVLEEKEKSSQVTRISLITGISGLVLLLVVVVVFFLQRARKNKELMDAEAALSAAELQTANLAQQQLRQELNWKQQELTNFTLNMVRTNGLFSEVEQAVEKAIRSERADHKELQNVLNVIRSQKRKEKDWDNFLKYFGGAHAGFFERLKQTYPDLNSGDLKHCALLKLNLNNAEAAEILGISANSVKVARYRLRKKMDTLYGKVLEEEIVNY